MILMLIEGSEISLIFLWNTWMFMSEWVSNCIFNANSAIFQLFHGVSKLFSFELFESLLSLSQLSCYILK